MRRGAQRSGGLPAGLRHRRANGPPLADHCGNAGPGPMKLTVAMITYNHEPFIAQALDSILMQQVSFDHEILIGEDCSTDRTREIVRAYRQRYPDKIRLQLPETNRGMMQNFVAVLAAARGDYVALLEGDDYWTAPDKLARQVAYLDAHPECAICFHDALML